MTRAARAWAALTDAEKERVFTSLHGALGEPGAAFVRALAADAALHTALHGAAYQHWLIPEHEAGPRIPAAKCQDPDCPREVTAGLTPFFDFQTNQLLYLGEGCYRRRMGVRRRGDDLPGDVQQPFPTPLPIQED